jgi:hypothetical protein
VIGDFFGHLISQNQPVVSRMNIIEVEISSNVFFKKNYYYYYYLFWVNFWMAPTENNKNKIK